MARVTLINPPTIVNMSSLSFHNSIPPLGLAYISAVTKQAGHQVQIIDAPGESIETYHPLRSGTIEGLFLHGLSLTEIVERISADTQIVGITNMFLHEWPLLNRLITLIKQRFPEIKIVLGGETPSAFWQHMLTTCPALDFCVLGEGETCFEELIIAIDSHLPIEGVPSVAFRNDQGTPIKSQGSRKRIRDIDALPWPDWEAFPVEAYLEHQYSSGVKRGRSLPMISSRGCPYQCTFCSSPEMWTTRYVTREPAQVIDEVAWYVERYRIQNVDFHDLTSMLTKRWILDFCDMMAQRSIQISWQLPSGTRCEALDRETLAALYRSGCRNLSYSPESGSEEMLETMKKRVKIPVLLKSVRSAVQEKIVSNVNFILGMPAETWKDRWKTYQLIVKLALAGAHSTAVMVFNPYPGSQLFQQLYEKGMIPLSNEYYYSSLLRSGKTSTSYNPTASPLQLVWTQYLFLLTFFGIQYLLRPQRFLKILYTVCRSKAQESNLEQFLSTKWFYLKKKRFSRSHGVAIVDLT